MDDVSGGAGDDMDKEGAEIWSALPTGSNLINCSEMTVQLFSRQEGQ